MVEVIMHWEWFAVGRRTSIQFDFVAEYHDKKNCPQSCSKHPFPHLITINELIIFKHAKSCPHRTRSGRRSCSEMLTCHTFNWCVLFLPRPLMRPWKLQWRAAVYSPSYPIGGLRRSRKQSHFSWNVTAQRPRRKVDESSGGKPSVFRRTSRFERMLISRLV